MLTGAWWLPATLAPITRENLEPDVTVALPVPNDSHGIELYLVDAAGEILDRRVEHPGLDPW